MTLRQSAPWAPGAKRTSGPFTGGPPKILLHATIAPAMALPDYAGQSMAPHVTLRWNGTNLVPNQHYYWDQFSKALANKPGGVETNRDGVRQIELAGYLNDRPGQFNILKAPYEYWKQVGDFLRPLARDLGLAKNIPADWTTKGRMGFSEWDNFEGLCAHVHAPENDHWDLPIPEEALNTLAINMFAAPPKVIVASPVPVLVTTKVPKFPLSKGHYFGRLSMNDKYCHSGYYSATDRANIRVMQKQLRLRGWNIDVDGLFGPTTEGIVRQFQREKGLAADGRVGSVTWPKFWTAKVT